MVNHAQPLRKNFTDSEKQRGFSLVELLVVVAVIGLIAAIAIPSFLGARTAAQNADAVATLRSIGTLQMMFKLSNERYARLAEINQMNGNALGTNAGPTLQRQNFRFQMSPTAPTPEQLESYYRIFASGQAHDGTLYQYKLEANGEITQIAP